MAKNRNFDRNRVRGCIFGSEGGAVLDFRGCIYMSISVPPRDCAKSCFSMMFRLCPIAR